MEREATTNLWETVVPLLRDQLTESVWFSTFNDAVNVGDGSGCSAVGTDVRPSIALIWYPTS